LPSRSYVTLLLARPVVNQQASILGGCTLTESPGPSLSPACRRSHDAIVVGTSTCQFAPRSLCRTTSSLTPVVVQTDLPCVLSVVEACCGASKRHTPLVRMRIFVRFVDTPCRMQFWSWAATQNAYGRESRSTTGLRRQFHVGGELQHGRGLYCLYRDQTIRLPTARAGLTLVPLLGASPAPSHPPSSKINKKKERVATRHPRRFTATA